MKKVYFRDYFLKENWDELLFPLILNGIGGEVKDFVIEKVVAFSRKNKPNLEVKFFFGKEIVKNQGEIETFLSPSLFDNNPKLLVFKSVEKLNKDEFKKFQAFLAGILDEGEIIICLTPEKKFNLSKGVQLECFFPTGEEIKTYLERRFSDFKVDRNILLSLAKDYGENLLLLEREIEKIILYLNFENELSWEDYQKLSYPSSQGSAFEITEFFLKKDLTSYQNFLIQLRRQGNDKVVLPYLSKFYFQLFKFKVLKSYYKKSILLLEKRVRNYFSTLKGLEGWRYFKRKKELEKVIMEEWKGIYRNFSPFHQNIVALEFAPKEISRKKQGFLEIVRFSSYLSFSETKKVLSFIYQAMEELREKQLELNVVLKRLGYQIIKLREENSRK